MWYWSEMVRNAIQSDFCTSKIATGGHLKKKNIYNKSWATDFNNVRTDCWPTTTWYKFTFGQYIYIQIAMFGTREYTLCSPFRANAHNSSCLMRSHFGEHDHIMNTAFVMFPPLMWQARIHNIYNLLIFIIIKNHCILCA